MKLSRRFLFAFIYRRRQWHPTPVQLPGKSQGWRSLVGCSPWGRWGLDTTEQLHFHFSLSCIEKKEMATHSSVVAWRIPGMGEPGGLLSMGSHRVGHDWSDLAVSTLYSPLQYSCQENTINGEAWWAAVHGVVKSWTRLSDFTFTFHFHALEKEMATHSNVVAWRIPGTGEPGGLPSMGSHRVGHNWSNLAAAAVFQQSQKGTK